MTPSAKLTIFEGCDGSGKTTAAKAYAAATNARYVHFGPLRQVSSGLARIYVEAMLPALLGYQDVVFDRSWLSEVPYGTAYRHGQDRLGDVQRRMLERLAMRCSAHVVLCDPGWRHVEVSYLTRRQEEMLADTEQLLQVYNLYVATKTHLPLDVYDFFQAACSIEEFIWKRRGADYLAKEMPRHMLERATAGNWSAKFVLVGEAFGDVKNQDALYQWPFASFSRGGCSVWLTQQLADGHVSERDLLWVNADQDLSFLVGKPRRRIIALGEAADAALSKLALPHAHLPHPQYWKRFHSKEPYKLLELLHEDQS